MLEKAAYVGIRGVAELCWVVLCCAVALIVIASTIRPMGFFGTVLTFAAVYMWSRLDPFLDVSIYGFAFKSWHFPFVLMLIGMLMGGSPENDLIGVFIGHTVHFLRDLVPQRYRKNPFVTPKLWYRLFEGKNPPPTSRANIRTLGSR